MGSSGSAHSIQQGTRGRATPSASASLATTMIVASLAVALLFVIPAQESTRTLDKPGEKNKHLTIDTVDRWLLEGVDDEVLRVDIRSNDFDPVLELVRLDSVGRVTEILVPEVDDPGSTSHFLHRLDGAGPLAILVHGPGNRGGGNYRLYVERLGSEPLPEGAEYLVGRLDRKGNAHVRVQAEVGQPLVPRGRGVIEVIDPKGISLENWRGCYSAQRAGEHYLRVRGEPRAPFRVGLATVPRRAIEIGASEAQTLEAGGLDEWTFDTKPGSLQRIELVGFGLTTRLVSAADGPGPGLDDPPAYRSIPTHSKGGTQRIALVARIAVGQTLQIRSSSDRPTPYRLTFRDPGAPLAWDAPTAGELAVGGSDYWTFDAVPGQVVSLRASSEAFDPALRLYDSFGALIAQVDDAGGDVSAVHSWLVTSRGRIYAEVHSYGHGGGGAYHLQLASLDVPTIAAGDRPKRPLAAGERAYWHLDVQDQEQLLVLVNADGFDPSVRVIDPDGVERWSASGSADDGGVLLNLRRPGSGQFTLVVEGRGGEGTYSLRVLDPDR